MFILISPGAALMCKTISTTTHEQGFGVCIIEKLVYQQEQLKRKLLTFGS